MGIIKVQCQAVPVLPHLLLDKHTHVDRGSAQNLKFVAFSTHLVPAPTRGAGSFNEPAINNFTGTATGALRSQRKQRPYHKSQLREVVLSNKMGVPLTFTVATTEPFQVVSTKCVAPPHPLNAPQVRFQTGGGGGRGGAAEDSLALSRGGGGDEQQTWQSGASSDLLLSRRIGQPGHGGIFTLPPEDSLTLHLVFAPPRPAPSQRPGVLVLDAKHEGQLNLHFSTGHTQTVQLTGLVHRPMLVCSPSEHDFGWVHCEGKCEFVLWVSNPTEVEATWRLVHVPVPPPKVSVIASANDPVKKRPDDNPDAFSFSEYNGRQSGPSLPLASSGAALPLDFNRRPNAVFTQTITDVAWRGDTTLARNLARKNDDNPRMPRPVVVTFRPPKNVAYQSRFRFEVEHGEGFDLVLSGHGTYEENTAPNPPPHV